MNLKKKKARQQGPHQKLIRVKKEQGWEKTPSDGVLAHTKMLKGHHSVLKSTPLNFIKKSNRTQLVRFNV